MNQTITEKILEELNSLEIGKKTGCPVLFGVEGYSSSYLKDIESEYGFKFPPDLFYLLTKMKDPQKILIDWESKEKIERALKWPLEGFEFDIEYNGHWGKSWGPKPVILSDKLDTFRKLYATWPKLVPVYGHRYIPSIPHETDNPIFSVHQFDIIIYGCNLIQYLYIEFMQYCLNPIECSYQPTDKEVPIWSDILNYDYFIDEEAYAWDDNEDD